MAKVNPYLPMISLNRNELNSPVKRHSLAEWIKNKVNQCYLQETYFTSKDTCRLKMKELKQDIPINGKQKRKVAIFTSDKAE